VQTTEVVSHCFVAEYSCQILKIYSSRKVEGASCTLIFVSVNGYFVFSTNPAILIHSICCKTAVLVKTFCCTVCSK